MRRKSYRKIIIFQLVLLLILLINGIFYNFLSNYYIVLFLLLAIVVFKFIFNFEKDRHRHTKQLILDIVIYLLSFFVLYYLSGIFITFVKNPGYYSLYGFVNFTLRIAIYIVLREFLRYQILQKCGSNKTAIILSIVMFVFMDISNNLFVYNFSSKYEIFVFIALYYLPALGENSLATYLSIKSGYKPVLVYTLAFNLHTYLLPIAPNPDRYILSVIYFCLPMVLLYRMFNFFRKENDEYPERDYRKGNIVLLIISIIITIILVYFTSGLFHYHAVAVASGSMYPEIHKGDVVIIEKLDKRFEDVKTGDILAFIYNNHIIVHRVKNIVKDRGEYFYYTKGDNNANDDDFVVEENMVKGIVKAKIPLIGMPTVWINEL